MLEFHISYSHTECHLLSSLNENGDENWMPSAVDHNSKLTEYQLV